MKLQINLLLLFFKLGLLKFLKIDLLRFFPSTSTIYMFLMSNSNTVYDFDMPI